MKKIYQGIIFPILAYMLSMVFVSGVSLLLNCDINNILLSGIAAIIGNIILFLNSKFNKNLEVDICFVNEKNINIRKIMYLIPISFGYSLTTNIIFSLLKLYDIFKGYERVSNEVLTLNPILQILFVGFIIPIIEEIIFRGYIYKSLKSYKGILFAKIVSAILFSVFHMNFLQGIFAFLSTFLITYYYDEIDNIIVPIFMHIIINMTSFLITPEFLFNDNNFKDKIFIIIISVVIGIIGIYKFSEEKIK